MSEWTIKRNCGFDDPGNQIERGKSKRCEEKDINSATMVQKMEKMEYELPCRGNQWNRLWKKEVYLTI